MMTEKMHMESVDITAQNIEKIGALFPNCITETKDADGKLKKAINFELLKQMLSEDVVGGDEAYEFTWVGKKAAIAEANKPIRKTLRPCPEESVDWDNTENLYIEGDNLQVLKLLQESYLGKVKMIYIDPPYNRGEDVLYRDDFKRSAEDYEEDSGVYDEDGNRMFKNTDSNGRFHSDWCSMIYSRLMRARDLLSDDGVIFISIGEEEIENLHKIADEVMGRRNLLGTILWKKKTNGNNMGFLPPVHDYIICYAKNINGINDMGYPVSKEFIEKNFSNPDDDPRGPWTTSDLSANHKGPFFPITNPTTGESFFPPEGRYWVFNAQEVQKRIADGRIIFGKSGTARPVQKVFAADRKFKRTRAESWWDKNGMNEDATAELKKLFGVAKLFTHPKPTKLLKHLIAISTEKNDIVLDFFSGSSTTADAVMQINAEDNGRRKFIMVQLPEACDEKSEAYKAGYKNICEIGKERIRRAGTKIKEGLSEHGYALKKLKEEGVPFQMAIRREDDTSTDESFINNPEIISGKSTGTYSVPDNVEDIQRKMADELDIGFRVLKLDDSNMNEVYYSPAEYSQTMLSEMESNVKSDRTDLDLLFGCLLEWGLPLSLPYRSEQIDGCTVHDYNDGDLIACFDKNIPDSVIKEIAKRQPLRAVFRDSSFVDSPSKINVGEIFKLLAPDTRIKVI